MRRLTDDWLSIPVLRDDGALQIRFYQNVVDYLQDSMVKFIQPSNRLYLRYDE